MNIHNINIHDIHNNNDNTHNNNNIIHVILIINNEMLIFPREGREGQRVCPREGSLQQLGNKYNYISLVNT